MWQNLIVVWLYNATYTKPSKLSDVPAGAEVVCACCVLYLKQNKSVNTCFHCSPLCATCRDPPTSFQNIWKKLIITLAWVSLTSPSDAFCLLMDHAKLSTILAIIQCPILKCVKEKTEGLFCRNLKLQFCPQWAEKVIFYQNIQHLKQSARTDLKHSV